MIIFFYGSRFMEHREESICGFERKCNHSGIIITEKDAKGLRVVQQAFLEMIFAGVIGSKTEKKGMRCTTIKVSKPTKVHTIRLQ